MSEVVNHFQSYIQREQTYMVNLLSNLILILEPNDNDQGTNTNKEIDSPYNVLHERIM